MKRLKIYVSMLLAVCMAFSTPVEAAVNGTGVKEQGSIKKAAGGGGEYAKGQAIILYRESAAGRTSAFANSLGDDMQIGETYEFEDADAPVSVQAADKSRSVRAQTLKVSLVKSDSYSTEELIKKLSARKDILAAEPNYRIHTLDQGQDPYHRFQWAVDNQGQNKGTAGLDINMGREIPGASPDGEECVIALVDTGMDYTHEDLKNVVWQNPIQTNQLKGAHGYDFINYDADPMDDNGHGTHCSGIMAAEWNNTGIRGVVNNDKIKIMALKILDGEGYGYEMESVGAYNYIYKAQQLGINVVAVNNSWGGLDAFESVIFEKLVDLVGEKGAVSVCAAGNEAGNNDNVDSLPATLDSDYIISVAASNENDELAAYSNYGADSVDLAAPGADILSSVSYDCFNPGIYEDKSNICSLFEDFSDGNLVQDVTSDDGDIVYGYATGRGKAAMALGLSDEAYFGLQGSNEKALKWSIDGAKAGDIYTVYFPYMAGASETDVHASIMTKAVGPDKADISDGSDVEEDDVSALLVSDVEMPKEGKVEITDATTLMMESIAGVYVDKGNYWTHLSGFAHEGDLKAKKYAVAVSLIVSQDGNYEIYLDNMGVSKENITSDQFGKYDFYNGTSMAAPYVTGAAAVLAAAYPKEDALDIVERIFGCTRKSSALNGKVATGGTLDLSKIGTSNIYIKKVLIDKNKNIRIEGRGLSGASVTVNGKTARPKSQNQEEIILDASDLWNKTLDIAVTVGEKVMHKQCFFVGGTDFSLTESAVGYLGKGYTLSDGEWIYYVDEDGAVSYGIPGQKDEMGDTFWMDGMYGYSTELFDVNEELMVEDTTISNISEIVCLDGKLWTVLKLDMKYSEERILACYDTAGAEWKAASKLPERFENLEGISIAGYQGKLYLLGGMDNATLELQTCVMRMNTQTLKWEAAAALPEARAFAHAVSTEDKLVLTLGKNKDNTIPYNMVFDGKSWNVSKAELKGISEDGVYVYIDKSMYLRAARYYTGTVGAVKGGLVYTGMKAENLGDTFFYQLASDKYEASGYALANTGLKDLSVIQAAVMQDKLYVLASDDSRINFFSVPVQSACVEVYCSDSKDDDVIEGGILTGVRHYMPGDVICVTPEPEEGFYVKEFKVDGKKVVKGANGKYQYRSLVNVTKGRIPVSVKFGAYVTDILMDETVDLYPGQFYPLEASVLPYYADNQKLIWTSSKPGIVSVDEDGWVSVSKKAKRGSTAVITVTAADRKSVKASCKVTITSMPLPWKDDIANSGKLKYKVTASSAKKKTVTCTGFSDKVQQKVKIPETIKINGYTFKVTAIAKNAFAKNKKIKSVTIGKNVTSIGQGAFQNCKMLKSVQIKGTSLKTINKNAFKGISKKAVVRVPKKQKRSYTSKLKKAGYSGKIK